MPGCWKKSSAFIVGPGRKFRQLVLKGLRGSKAFCFSDFFFKLKDNCFTDFSCFLPNVPQRLLVQFSRSVVSGSLPDGLQHTRPPCPSPTPRAYSNSCPLNWWRHPTISSSVVPFSSCLQSLPASGSFLMSQLFPSGSQNIGASVSATVLPRNIQGRFSLGLTGFISLKSKGFSRVFFNITV